MAKWKYCSEQKIIRCGTTIEKEQKETLGYGGRTIVTMQCTKCNKLTMVDDTVRYDYCPHCGEKMEQYWEVYPTWENWLTTLGVQSFNELSKPIPAEIAEKLGIVPKEG